MDGGRLQPIDVRLGVTDGTASELLAGGPSGWPIADGTQLVTNMTTPEGGAPAAAGGGGSPLIPQFGRGRR